MGYESEGMTTRTYVLVDEDDSDVGPIGELFKDGFNRRYGSLWQERERRTRSAGGVEIPHKTRESGCSLESTTKKFFLPLESMLPVPARRSPVMESWREGKREDGGREGDEGLTSSAMVAMSVRSRYELVAIRAGGHWTVCGRRRAETGQTDDFDAHCSFVPYNDPLLVMATYDCLIIGSGFAGLCAARVLAPTHRVLVLEARPRVGGRAQTNVEGDFRVDLGCAQVHGWNEGNPLRGIMDSLNLVSCSSGNAPGYEADGGVGG